MVCRVEKPYESNGRALLLTCYVRLIGRPSIVCTSAYRISTTTRWLTSVAPKGLDRRWGNLATGKCCHGPRATPRPAVCSEGEEA